MELNALDFVSKHKDLLTDGVVVDPVLDKAQSLFLNKMVVHMTDTIGFGGCAHTKYGEIWTSTYDTHCNFYCDNILVEGVTHWMPIPELPEE